MAINLSNSEIPSNDVERERIEGSIETISTVVDNRHVNYTDNMLSFVKNLQKFIDTNHGSVNIFLSNNDILVKSTFASLSGAAGYPINSSNIEGGNIS